MQKIELIDFIHLNHKEIKMAYSWRNNTNIRKWMFNNKEIPFNEHINFIDNLKLPKFKKIKYFLVLEEDNYLGVITFKNIDLDLKQCEIGLYSNPKKRNLGKVLINQCIEYGFIKIGLSRLIVQVFTDNNKAIKLYNKLNFKEISKSIIEKKEIICMELIATT